MLKIPIKKKKKEIKEIADEYINFLNHLNINKKSATKNFYIIIKNNKKNNYENINNIENIIFEELNDNYLKIKDTLSRCGNIVIDINDKKQCKIILFSFFYPKRTLN